LAASVVIQALFAVVSPLYYSNFGDPISEFISGQWLDSSDFLDPCHLCWWARIMMFPILPLSLIYAVTSQRGILWYIYIITIPGMLLELFHYILQKPYLVGQDVINNPFGCTAANPCAAVHVDYFGIFTIPFLCFLAFLVIHIAVSFILFSKKIEKATK
jgi:disulfide bond formation protein DsbB